MAEPKKRTFSFDKLKKTEKDLYARGEVKPGEKPELLQPTTNATSGAQSDWQEIPEHLAEKPEEHRLIKPATMKKILISAGGFFLVSIGFAAYIFFGGANKVSVDNVAITINGSSTIGAGEPLSFDINVQNRNNVALEGVKLLVEYPVGTRTADDQEKDLPRELEEMDNIPANGNIQRSKQAALFGAADSSQHIIVSVEFRVKDSSATYFKEQYYDVLISTAPVRMTINSVPETVSGSELEISAEIVSNATSVISGLMLRVDYPFGFQFNAAAPSPAYSNNVFLLGDFQPADRRVIRIKGTVTGQEGDDRLFRFNLGLPGKNDNRVIGKTFLFTNHPIAIKRPFVSAVLSLDGSNSDTYAVPAGQVVRGEVSWTNNLDSRIADLEIQAKLSGESLNRLSVSAGNGGYYNSLDNTILWNKITSPGQAVVDPGETGLIGFSFSPLPLSSLLYSGIRGNEMTVDITVKARRLSGANIPEEIFTGISKKILVSSNIALSGRSLYYTGAFSNQGPVPPKAEVNTTYTAVWALTNTLNSVSGMRVSATLPVYVTWLGNVSSGESVVYEPANRSIVWNVGDLPAGTGFSSSPREAAFQVSIVPSLSQLGSSPTLITEAVASGVDRFSSVPLKSTTKAVSTDIEDGPQGMRYPGRVEQ